MSDRKPAEVLEQIGMLIRGAVEGDRPIHVDQPDDVVDAVIGRVELRAYDETSRVLLVLLAELGAAYRADNVAGRGQ